MEGSTGTIKTNYYKENLNIMLYSTGKFISSFGTYIYTFAIGLYVLRLTGSGLSFVANLILSIIPTVVINPAAGVFADRFNKKVLIVTMDILSGVILLVLYLLSLKNGLSLSMIYTATFSLTVFTTIFDISLESGIPNIVSEKRLMFINSLGKIIDASSSVLGPMLGGLVFAFVDIKFFIIINGISFIISGVSELFIYFNVSLKAADKKISISKFIYDIQEGFSYLFQKKELVKMITLFISINFFLSLSVSVPLPYIINNVLKLSSKYFGIIEAAFPVGVIVGAIFVGQATKKISYEKLIFFVGIILGSCMISLGLPILIVYGKASEAFYLIYYFLISVVMGINISFLDIPAVYILQKNVTEEFRGRVMSLLVSLGKIISPIALLLAGILVNHSPSYAISMIGGIILILFNAALIEKDNRNK